jgi:hypothetical protein
MAVAMIFVVTGPTNSKEQRTILVEAPTSDAAALGAGVALGVEVGGHAQIDDFRDPETTRDYQYIRSTDVTQCYEYYKITPARLIKVDNNGNLVAIPDTNEVCHQQ